VFEATEGAVPEKTVPAAEKDRPLGEDGKVQTGAVSLVHRFPTIVAPGWTVTAVARPAQADEPETVIAKTVDVAVVPS